MQRRDKTFYASVARIIKSGIKAGKKKKRTKNKKR